MILNQHILLLNINILNISIMAINKEFALAVITVILAAGALFMISPDQERVQCTSRSTMIARGQDWVDKNIPYNKTYDGYHTGCSGFVSMCWGIARPGISTEELVGRSRSTSKNDLSPGDALLCPGTHVTLFVNWADSGKTSYVMME